MIVRYDWQGAEGEWSWLCVRIEQIYPIAGASSLIYQSALCMRKLLRLILTLNFCRVFVFRWNHDGKYFARMTENLLSVYEVPVSMTLYLLLLINTDHIEFLLAFRDQNFTTNRSSAIIFYDVMKCLQ